MTVVLCLSKGSMTYLNHFTRTHLEGLGIDLNPVNPVKANTLFVPGYGDGEHYSHWETHLDQLQKTDAVTYYLTTMNPWVVDQILDIGKFLFLQSDDTLKPMSEKDAIHCRKTYLAGYKHVSEILVSTGLW